MQEIGVVRGIFRYPVKSMAAQPLQTCYLGWHGLDGDRRFAFRGRGPGGRFSWLTATRLPELVSYRPEDADSAASAPSGLRVLTPDGRRHALEDPLLSRHLSAAHGAEVDLIHLRQGIFDEAAVSLITTQTIAHLEHETGTRLDPRRFRPNLLVDASGGEAFAEDAWVGRRLVIDPPAGPAVRITQRDPRCAMVNLEPDSAVADPRVLRAIARNHGNFAGVYAAPVRPGAITAGATVHLADDA